MSTMNRDSTHVFRAAIRPRSVLRPERVEGAYALSWAYAPRNAWSWGESNPLPEGELAVARGMAASAARVHCRRRRLRPLGAGGDKRGLIWTWWRLRAPHR
jgi:hypothetical protein